MLVLGLFIVLPNVAGAQVAVEKYDAICINSEIGVNHDGTT